MNFDSRSTECNLICFRQLCRSTNCSWRLNFILLLLIRLLPKSTTFSLRVTIFSAFNHVVVPIPTKIINICMCVSKKLRTKNICMCVVGDRHLRRTGPESFSRAQDDLEAASRTFGLYCDPCNRLCLLNLFLGRGLDGRRSCTGSGR